MRAFLDTNILVYSNSQNDDKHAIALGLLKKGSVISIQVLNEYCAISRRKGAQAWRDVSAKCDDFVALFDVCDLTLENQILARNYAIRFGYSIYDANILASAKLSGCDTLWSEDMAHGQVIDGVTIINPFVDRP
jgi:predicted nucleic acid-binding protein